MITTQLNDDLKAAMLAHDAGKVEAIRGLKSVILYAEVASGKRDTGLSDDEVQALLAKEAKKRQESADLYVQGGSQDRADKELREKALIETYLPARLSEAEVTKIIDEQIASVGATGPQDMGKVIGGVKAQTGSSADGSLIARLVKERLAA